MAKKLLTKEELEQKALKKECQDLWALNKYLVLSKSKNIYREIRQYLKQDDVELVVVQNYIQEALLLQEDRGAVMNAAQHIWGYFKRLATREEKQKIVELLDLYRLEKIEKEEVFDFLKEMLDKYPNKYLANSNIFEEY